jgi:uncharacterized protein YuzE
MELRPQFRHDADVNALYIRFAEAPVAQTIELEELVYMDLDAQGRPLGVEFVNADDFLPYIRRHHGNVELPTTLFGQAGHART